VTFLEALPPEHAAVSKNEICNAVEGKSTTVRKAVDSLVLRGDVVQVWTNPVGRALAHPLFRLRTPADDFQELHDVP
jgi:hypothetical protein